MPKPTAFRLLRMGLAASLTVSLIASSSTAIAKTRVRPPLLRKLPAKTAPTKTITARKIPTKPGLPDIAITHYELTREGDSRYLDYKVTFKNIGQGPIGCFNWRILDGVSCAKSGKICADPNGNWKLSPGRTVVLTGRVARSDIWVWPAERGHMSKIRFHANYGSYFPESNKQNNATQKKLILWDQHIIQNSYQ